MSNTTIAPFPVDEVLTGITLAYQNPSYIADAVLPRVSVGLQAFKYQSYPIAESFALPNTRVGRKGQPPEVELTSSEQTSATEDFGLDDLIPYNDIANAAAGKSPVDRAVMQLTDYIAIDREKRVADLVFAAGSYGSGYKTQLSGTSQWSDYANSNPVSDLLAALDAPLMRPNVLVLGQEVWTKLRAHPKVLQASTSQAITGGIISRERLAEILEVEEILVGAGRYNTAKKGQTASLARLWGKHALVMYRNRTADAAGGLTFGFTAEWGTRFSGALEETKGAGLRGGTRVRVGESVKELIVASMAGYFIQDAVA